MPNNFTQKTLEQFREQFCFDSLIFEPSGERYKKTLRTNLDQTDALEAFLTQTLKDFAEEVEKNVIGEDEPEITNSGKGMIDGRYDVGAFVRNNKRRADRQKLSSLIGEL